VCKCDSSGNTSEYFSVTDTWTAILIRPYHSIPRTFHRLAHNNTLKLRFAVSIVGSNAATNTLQSNAGRGQESVLPIDRGIAYLSGAWGHGIAMV
jgi:hypothetical protein